MPLPRPQEGLVIHYEYLWRHESRQGEERGVKQRPCAVVFAAHITRDGTAEVVVAPITHSEPVFPSEGIEIPPRVKEHLGLDNKRSWVIVTDLNSFTWPGIDIHPVPRSGLGTFDYGYLPPRLFEQIRNRIVAVSSLSKATRRSE